MRRLMLVLLGGVLLAASYLTVSRGGSFASQDRVSVNAPATHAHPAGTDDLGRDRMVRLAVALVLSLGGACLASGIATVLAALLGGAAAFGPPWSASLLRFGSDLFHTLPWLFLFMIVRSALPLSTSPWQSGSLTFALFALLGAPLFVRINHERTGRLLHSSWMLHSHAMGCTFPQRLWQLAPHLKPLLWTQFMLYLPACLITEANLGALGLGLAEPLPSFGNYLAELQNAALLGAPHLAYLPIAVLLGLLVALELSNFRKEQL